MTEIFPKRSVFSPDEETYKINGYDVFMDPKAKGRGVVLYVKNVLSANIYNIETSFQEAIFCKIKLRNSDSMLIECFSRSPNSTIENFTSLTELLRSIMTMSFSHKLLMGDLNIKEINWAD